MKNRNLYIFIGILLLTSLVIYPKIIEGIQTYEGEIKRCNHYYKLPKFEKDKPVYKWSNRQKKIFRGKEEKVTYGHWCKSQLQPRKKTGKCGVYCRKIKAEKYRLDGKPLPQPNKPWVKIGETTTHKIYEKCSNPICT